MFIFILFLIFVSSKSKYYDEFIDYFSLIKCKHLVDGIKIVCFNKCYWACPNPENTILLNFFEDKYKIKEIYYISKEDFESEELWNI